MAALEFAVLLPLIVILFFGTYEVTRVLRLNLKLAHAAGAMTEMISKQVTGVTPGVLSNICTGAAMILNPFNGALLSAAVASVTNYGGTATLDWESDDSCATDAAPLGAAGAIALASTPVNLIPNGGDSIIVVKVTYAYTSVTDIVLATAFTFNQVSFTRPNNNMTIACSGC